jgi:hypothetical protein
MDLDRLGGRRFRGSCHHHQPTGYFTVGNTLMLSPFDPRRNRDV